MKKTKEKGITMIALIFTIIILTILTSIATHVGTESIDFSQYNKFENELKLIQAKVNEDHDKYIENYEDIPITKEAKVVSGLQDSTDYNGVTGKEIKDLLSYGNEKIEPIYNVIYSNVVDANTELNNQKNERNDITNRISNASTSDTQKTELKKKLNDLNDTIAITERKTSVEDSKKNEIQNSFYYCPKEILKKYYDIDVTRDYIISFKYRYVISTQGLKYQDTNYYIIDQFGASTHNVRYENNYAKIIVQNENDKSDEVINVEDLINLKVNNNNNNNALLTKELSKLYGQKVDYNTEESNTPEISQRTWRIFYIDLGGKYAAKGTIFLKADYSEDDVQSFTNEANYNPINTTTITKLNPCYESESTNGELKSTADWKAKDHIVAWLCDPTQWTKYKNSLAEFAIGGPSIAMYCDSYNSVNHNSGADFKVNGTTDEDKKKNSSITATYGKENIGQIKYKDGTTGIASFGYYYKKGTESTILYDTGNNTIDYNAYNSIYCGVNRDKTSNWTYGSWWIASPSAIKDDSLCVVKSNTASLYGSEDNKDKYGICPVVALKSNINIRVLYEN